MDRSQIAIVITLGIAVVASVRTVRASKSRENIYGGVLAELFHHLGVIGYLAVLPAALLGTFLVGPLRFGIPFALTCLLVALVCFFAYAVVERTARVGLVIEDRGWTEEDARSSGL